MVFSSLTFLYLFFPACLLLYFVLPWSKAKNAVLIVASVFFYAWGEPVYVLLMIAAALLNYAFGLLLDQFRGTKYAKPILIVSIIADLAALVFFKYAGFLAGIVNGIFGNVLSVPKLALPIGISFYTFQTMSYTIDVYRGNVKKQTSFWRFLLYVSLFPQLIAGPIVRYAEIEPQLEKRETTVDDVFYGALRFFLGLGKKVLIANYAGKAATLLLEEASAMTVAGTWFGMILFAFQIYFDFSGYSDMAIDMGRIFGFRYAENFNLPYTARSITEFWRKWHISLSTFFRDYVYIPLGGNRKHQMLNLLVVWALTGLWHGASWNFLFWGLYFCLLLILEKRFLPQIEKIPMLLRRIGTLVLVLIGWVIFYFTDLAQMGAAFSAMFGGAPLCTQSVAITMLNNLPLLLVCVIGSTSLPRRIGLGLDHLCALGSPEQSYLKQVFFAIGIFLMEFAILLLSTVSLVGSSYNPFLYFRF